MKEQIISTAIITRIHSFRFKSSLFGKQVLQVGSLVRDWDASTGKDMGEPYVKWKNATKNQADILFKPEGITTGKIYSI